MSGEAAAGEFRVASCQADRLNFSTQAFSDFATRGMRIKRACNPEGPGLRGLITANVVEPGRVARGAVALATINAPVGHALHELPVGGHGPSARLPLRAAALRRRARCQADRAQERAREPSAARAPGAPRPPATRSRTFNISGATRIVQRVICVGGTGASRAPRAAPTTSAPTRPRSGSPTPSLPPSGSSGDSALARGEWVSGTQPLNYDASDNVGVRTAQAVVSGQTGGTHQRQCALASPDGAFANGVPCPNGPGHIDVNTSELAEGTQPLSCRPRTRPETPGPRPR